MGAGTVLPTEVTFLQLGSLGVDVDTEVNTSPYNGFPLPSL